MLRKTLFRLGLTPCLMAVAALNVGADVFQTDFSSTPAGVRLFGSPLPVIEDGVLKLTKPVNSSFGAMAIGPFAPVTINNLVATWKSRVGGGAGGGADGYSFNVGSDLADAFTAEEGTGTGLTVTIDTFDNGTGQDVGVDIKWAGTRIGYAGIPKDNPGNGVFLRKDAFVDAALSLASSGNVTFIYDGTTISATIPGFTGLAANQMMFAGRTGGANDNHWIDDVRIVTQTPDVLLIQPQGTTWAYNDTTLAAANLHGTGWELPGYDTTTVPGWKDGQSLLGNDGAGIYNAAGQPFSGGINGFSTPLNRGSSDRATFYFRTAFNWTGPTAGVSLISSNWVDDGMVAYLNGVEVSRIRLPDAPAPIDWATLGSNPPIEGVVEVRTLSAASLVQGQNVIAVEVHQSGLGSSDVAFAMSLKASAPLPPTITDPTQPANRSVFASRDTTLTVSAIGSPAVTYAWYHEGVAIDPLVNPSAATASLLLSNLQAADAGSYFVRVANSIGSADSRTAVVTYVVDVTAPVITSAAGSFGFDKITVNFDELIDFTTANDPFNYTISGGLNVLSVALTANGRGVVLTTDTQAENTAYTVTVTGVKDFNLNEIIANGVGNVGSFTSYAQGRGLALFEAFGSFGGNAVADLIAHPSFPSSPRETFYIGGFDTRIAYPTDVHENYGGRLRALFIPPTSGNWIFYQRADDGSQVLFNPAGPSAAGAVEIQANAACCATFAANASAPQALVAGQAYYLEALYKEGGGGDYCAVAAKLDTDPTDPAALSPIPAAWLGFYASPVGATVNLTQSPTPVTVLENQAATFTAAGNGSWIGGGNVVAYRWQRSTDGGVSWLDIFTQSTAAGTSSYTLPIPKIATDNGAHYRVVLSVPGREVTSASVLLTVADDTTAPTILSASGNDTLDKITVRFSELMDPATVSDGFNYAVSGGLNVDSALITPDGRGAVISLVAGEVMTPDTDYTVTVSGVKDASTGANEIAAGSTVTLHSFSIGGGFVNFTTFEGIGTTAVATLTSDPRYPNSPTRRFFIGAFDTRLVLPTDSLENYGGRIVGFFVPPTSGNWILYLRSDDASELWFNANGSDAAGKVKVQEDTGCCGAFDAHATAPFALTAGTRYYIEGLYKEAGGGDYLQVAAKLDTDPTPPNSLRPISGASLATYLDAQGVSLTINPQPADATFISAPNTLAIEEFNTTDGGFTVETPIPWDGQWRYDSARGTWHQEGQDPENSQENTSILISRAYSITKPGNVSLRFAHRYSWEQDWDGGVVQVSVNGSAFTTVPNTSFSQNGYNGTLNAGSRSQLKGQLCFYNTSANFATAYITSVCNLGSLASGDTVRFRFLGSSDSNTRGSQAPPSWEIDRVQVEQGGAGPTSVSFSIGIVAVSPNLPNPPVFYQWYRDGVAISGANSATYSLAPVLADNGAKFKVTAFIPGAQATSREATLTVIQPNTAPQFACGPNQTVAEDAAAQTIAGWATGIQVHSIIRSPIVYGSDFTAPPAGATLAGTAAISGGVLHLTDAVNGASGQFFTPGAGALIESFNLDFKLRIGGGTCCGGAIPEGTSRMADGLSVNIGNDLGTGFGEEGTGTGITVSFDLWDNGGGDDAFNAPDIDIRNGGTILGYQALDGEREGGRAPSGPLVNDPATGLPMTLITGDAFAPVRIHMDADGTMDVDYKGVRVINNVQTGYHPINNPSVGIGARTGGANANQWIDDLLLQAFTADSSGAEAGQTLQFTVSNSNPSLFSAQPSISPSGTLTYTPAPNQNGSALVTVVLKDNGGTANGGRDTSEPCSFLITVTPVCDAPVAANDSATTDYGVAVTLNALANDTDIEGGLAIASVTQGAHGAVTFAGGNVTYTPAAGFIGADSFSYTVANSCGARSTATVTVAVVDRVAPTVTCPGNIIAEPITGSSAVVTYVASATDAGGIATFACVPPSGSTFPSGVTTVTCTATDNSGNRNSCSFTVTVRQNNQPPTAVITADQLVDFTPDFENPVLISCNWWNACIALDGYTSSDPEGGALTYLWFVEPDAVPFAAGPLATNCLELGTYTIALTVTDPTGLSGTATKTIEVVTGPLAIEILIEKVNQSRITRKLKRELTATLRTALRQAGNENTRATANTLDAFEKKVRAISTSYPAEATSWIRWSQAVTDGMEKCLKQPRKPKGDDDGKKDHTGKR